jgi:hypothetical protein
MTGDLRSGLNPVAVVRALSNRMVHAGTAFQGPALVAA